VIAVDANLLVYAHVTSYPTARRCPAVARGAVGRFRAGRSALGERLVTNPRLFTEPESVADAWEQVEAWLTTIAAALHPS